VQATTSAGLARCDRTDDRRLTLAGGEHEAGLAELSRDAKQRLFTDSSSTTAHHIGRLSVGEVLRSSPTR